MKNNFINIIREATKVYDKCINHPAMEYELIGVVGEAVEKMGEEDMVAFDEWFFSSEMRKNLTDKELSVVEILTKFMKE